MLKDGDEHGKYETRSDVMSKVFIWFNLTKQFTINEYWRFSVNLIMSCDGWMTLKFVANSVTSISKTTLKVKWSSEQCSHIWSHTWKHAQEVSGRCYPASSELLHENFVLLQEKEIKTFLYWTVHYDKCSPFIAGNIWRTVVHKSLSWRLAKHFCNNRGKLSGRKKKKTKGFAPAYNVCFLLRILEPLHF